MITMPDKGISSISYNHLNLPTQILQNGNTTDYTYRADGTKLKKKFTLVNKAGTAIINTVYLDGFQYSTPNTDPLRKALEAKDFNTREASTASLDEAFSMLDDRQLKSTDPAGGCKRSSTLFLTHFRRLLRLRKYALYLSVQRSSREREGQLRKKCRWYFKCYGYQRLLSFRNEFY